MLSEKFGKHIEKMVGLSLKEIREMSSEKLRKFVEKKNGKKLKVESISKYEHISAEEKDQENMEILKHW